MASFYLHQESAISWQSILNNWLTEPRSIVYSRYFPYLPGRIAHYLNTDSIRLRKDRTAWLLSLLPRYDMAQIDDQFYDFLPLEQSKLTPGEKGHTYDVNWALYDSLQPVHQATPKGGVPHE